jgi:hypothetical protein
VDEIEVQVYKDIQYGEQKFVFFSRRGDKRIIYNFFTGEKCEVEIGKEFDEKFVMKIPLHLWGDIAKQLAEILDEKGVKTDNDHKIQGIMKAQKYHLEDMRKLVFRK